MGFSSYREDCLTMTSHSICCFTPRFSNQFHFPVNNYSIPMFELPSPLSLQLLLSATKCHNPIRAPYVMFQLFFPDNMSCVGVRAHQHSSLTVTVPLRQIHHCVLLLVYSKVSNTTSFTSSLRSPPDFKHSGTVV